jgi:hypothetical protein
VEDDAWRILSVFLRAQRQMANLSLRQLSALAKVSNPYLRLDPPVKLAAVAGRGTRIPF